MLTLNLAVPLAALLRVSAAVLVLFSHLPLQLHERGLGALVLRVQIFVEQIRQTSRVASVLRRPDVLPFVAPLAA